MGRPRKSSTAIIVSADGKGLVWDETVGFVGDAVFVARCRTAVEYGLATVVHPLLPEVEASTDTPLNVYAAMVWATGGRDRLVSAPDDLYDIFDGLAATLIRPLADESSIEDRHVS